METNAFNTILGYAYVCGKRRERREKIQRSNTQTHYFLEAGKEIERGNVARNLEQKKKNMRSKKKKRTTKKEKEKKKYADKGEESAVGGEEGMVEWKLLD